MYTTASRNDEEDIHHLSFRMWCYRHPNPLFDQNLIEIYVNRKVLFVIIHFTNKALCSGNQFYSFGKSAEYIFINRQNDSIRLRLCVSALPQYFNLVFYSRIHSLIIVARRMIKFDNTKDKVKWT